ncbi:cation diffusion facilitator CzcD-associated flavoprotein CzcO [Williamsia limnetica]|uniref:Cation diffusion facilitator CzcD-associated flavoprotein CzcO n=1 Tax=Williamsia limnetica TaxID=882452 RepID=A0A318RRW0_WILLI|nr:NAD(P)/FAD-dependent oxidoreductase [Williamsia limnetica]PYE11716.1 cation diffusion facilitator CzcD-associated flavoprotein CzcO [Williamsia limnetica]
MASATTTSPDHTVAIVGAGFGGLAAGIKLQERGIDDYVIFDRNDDVGGTWLANRYPGVEVDIPSVTYSYKFALNPEWSQIFAPGSELLQYARDIAERYGIREHIRFGAAVVAADFDDDADLWTITTAAGDTVTARFLISCHGALSTPATPNLPGLEQFSGKVLRSASWDHDYDLTGKKVAIIGTGATGIQIIPTIAPDVEKLTVIQRTAIWVLPKPNAVVPGFLRSVYRRIPKLQLLPRFLIDSTFEIAETLGVVYNKQLPAITRGMEKLCKRHLRAQVKDAATREKLTPSYGYACKRPSFSNDYFPTFNRDNVDLETSPIAQITDTGIEFADGRELELDALILATGFKIFDLPYEIRGVGGQDLGKTWDSERMHAYEGITVPNFPNLFLAPGPYGVIGFSWFDTIELCVTHAVQVVAKAVAAGSNRVSATDEQTDEFVTKMRKRVRSTVFASPRCAGSNTYYINAQGDSPYLRPSSRVESIISLRKALKSGYEYSA